MDGREEMLMRRRRRRRRDELRPHNDRRRHLIPNGNGVAFAYDPCAVYSKGIPATSFADHSRAPCSIRKRRACGFSSPLSGRRINKVGE